MKKKSIAKRVAHFIIAKYGEKLSKKILEELEDLIYNKQKTIEVYLDINGSIPNKNRHEKKSNMLFGLFDIGYYICIFTNHGKICGKILTIDKEKERCELETDDGSIVLKKRNFLKNDKGD